MKMTNTQVHWKSWYRGSGLLDEAVAALKLRGFTTYS